MPERHNRSGMNKLRRKILYKGVRDTHTHTGSRARQSVQRVDGGERIGKQVLGVFRVELKKLSIEKRFDDGVPLDGEENDDIDTGDCAQDVDADAGFIDGNIARRLQADKTKQDNIDHCVACDRLIDSKPSVHTHTHTRNRDRSKTVMQDEGEK